LNLIAYPPPVSFFSTSQQEVEVQEVEEETKADNINDAIKSVIKKSQANDGRYRGLPLGLGKLLDLHED